MKTGSDISVADNLTTEVSGCYFIEDKGYDSDAYRAYLLSNNNTPVIAGRKNRQGPILYDQVKYKFSMRIENFFARLKENRRLALRYEQADTAFLAFVAFAAIQLWLC